MSTYPPPIRKSGILFRPMGVVKARGPRQLTTTTRPAVMTRLTLLEEHAQHEIPDKFCPLSVLLLSFEIDRTGNALRTFLANNFITDKSDTLFIGDIRKLRQRIAYRNGEPLSFADLQRINAAVQEEGKSISLTPEKEKQFTAHQYVNRVRFLFRMIQLRPSGVYGSVVPLAVLQEHGSRMSRFNPLEALNNLLSGLPATNTLEERIVIDEVYLHFLMREIEARRYKPSQRIGLPELLEINKAVQEKYSAKMGRQPHR